MTGETFVYETVVKETQLDSFGHLNNARYLEILEDARWEFISRNGYGLERVKETGLGPTILEVRIRFRKELLARQKIRVESRCVSYEGRIGRLEQRVLDEAGEECCTAEYVIGLLDLRARKLVPPTEEWKRAVGIRRSGGPAGRE